MCVCVLTHLEREQPSFYGIDLTSLYKDARDEMFGMPVVGHFDPRNLIASPTVLDAYNVDFATVTIPELQDLVMPFEWTAGYTGLMHGVAGWFNLEFAPPDKDLGTTVFMSTSPAADRTHWQQVRFLFREPLAVNATQKIKGWMRAIINDMRSYTIYVEVSLEDDVSDPSQLDRATFGDPQPADSNALRRRGRWELHEQTYNYSFTPGLMPDHKPEYSCLYEPEGQLGTGLLDETVGGVATPSAMDIQVMDEYEGFVN